METKDAVITVARPSSAGAEHNVTAGLYVHFGCHFIAPTGWLNFDASPTLRFEKIPIVGRLYTKNGARFPAHVRYGDIVKGLPVPEGSCQGVYASHVLEHLSLQDFHAAMRNTYQIMASGGVFRLVMPDLEAAARSYLRELETGNAEANSLFLQWTRLGYEKRPRGLFEFIAAWLGNSRHLWMWDYLSVRRVLAQHGFVRIRRCGYHDCPDKRFVEVEDQRRFENSLAVEARRP